MVCLGRSDYSRHRVLKRACELQGVPQQKLNKLFAGVPEAKPEPVRFSFLEKPVIDHALVAPAFDMPLVPAPVVKNESSSGKVAVKKKRRKYNRTAAFVGKYR